MKILSTHGFIYDVYDLENGRVLKVEKPKLRQYWKHFFYAKHTPFHVERNNALARKLAKNISDPSLLANPHFESSRRYTQDKVLLLQDYFLHHSLEENQRAVDLLIECIFETWKNGFADTIYNFMDSYGFDAQGRVVLVDFNEVTISRAIVAEKIRIKRWTFSYSFTTQLYWNNNEKLLAKTQ